MLISIVIPCYYSEKTIRKVVELVTEEFAQRDGYECEFVLVNDGSKDGTYAAIRELAARRPNVCGVNLMRNFGQHNALMAGLHFTNGDYILGMDDDLQTHPSQIFKMVEKMEEGYDLVYGVYKARKNAFLKNLTSKINEVSSRIMLNRPKEIQSSNFWIITRAVRDEVVKYDSFNPYIDGIFYQVTHNIGNVEVEHFKREYGTSGYTFKKLLNLWLAYWNFSVIPLRVSFILGIFFAIVGVLTSVLIIINKMLYPDIPVGWSSTMCVIVLLFGLVLMVLGVIGEYVGKIILILNKTPQYIVRETVNTAGTVAEMVKEVSGAPGIADDTQGGAVVQTGTAGAGKESAAARSEAADFGEESAAAWPGAVDPGEESAVARSGAADSGEEGPQREAAAAAESE